MTVFEFNCMTTANHAMNVANRQQYLAIYRAKLRKDARAAVRTLKQQHREAALDLAVRIAIAIGIVVTGWFLTSVFGN